VVSNFLSDNVGPRELGSLGCRAKEIGHTIAMFRFLRTRFIEEIAPDTWARETRFKDHMQMDHVDVLDDIPCPDGSVDCLIISLVCFRVPKSQKRRSRYLALPSNIQIREGLKAGRRCGKCFMLHPFSEVIPSGADRKQLQMRWKAAFKEGNCAEGLAFAILEAKVRAVEEVVSLFLLLADLLRVHCVRWDARPR
jgi:hypothetical protein